MTRGPGAAARDNRGSSGFADVDEVDDELEQRDGRHFARDPEWNLPPLPAGQPASPAIVHLMGGDFFEIDGDGYWVEEVLASSEGPQADLLLLRGYEYVRCPSRQVRRALQVRDLEAMIDQDRVAIAFGPGARRFNVARGWCYGGRTLAFHGIILNGTNRRLGATSPQGRQDSCE